VAPTQNATDKITPTQNSPPAALISFIIFPKFPASRRIHKNAPVQNDNKYLDVIPGCTKQKF